MYENLSIQKYLEKMNEWDNKRTIQAEDWIEEYWVPEKTFTYPNGAIIQYREFRGEENGISKN